MMLIPIVLLGFFGGWKIVDCFLYGDAKDALIGVLCIALGAVLAMVEVD